MFGIIYIIYNVYNNNNNNIYIYIYIYNISLIKLIGKKFMIVMAHYEMYMSWISFLINPSHE